MEHSIEAEAPGTRVIRLSGELDASQAPQLRELLFEELDEHHVALDLSGVPFIDSSGIGVLVAAHRRAGSSGTTLTIASPSDAASKVLALTRTDRVLRLFDDLPSAVAAATAATAETGAAAR